MDGSVAAPLAGLGLQLGECDRALSLARPVDETPLWRPMNVFAWIVLGGISMAALKPDISFLVPFAAGNFIYIAASNLVPEVNKHRGFGKMPPLLRVSWPGWLSFG